MPQQQIIQIILTEYPSFADLPPADQQLLNVARQMCDQAYAPYSNFYVGAALLLANGQIVKGSNQENAAYPSGICAERSAVYWAGANFPGVRIEKIAVAARRANSTEFLPAAPCGSCRQALAEYETQQGEPIPILLQSDEGRIYSVPSVASLLPLLFSRSSLLS